MRVIAGEAKGRRLRSAGRLVRPTEDRVKEALFSALGARVLGARVLDLYAGSGALGIESLSRGAASATFVERDPAALAMVRSNLQATGLAGRATVVRRAVERFAAKGGGPYDLVLMDPPYAEGPPPEILAALAGGLLAPGGTAAVEIASSRLPLRPPPGLEIAAERRYGDTALVYLRRAGESSGERC